MKRAAETDASGRRKLPFFIDPHRRTTEDRAPLWFGLKETEP
jgi:hypothetical protein